MDPNQSLHIYEEVFLLALRDKEGTLFNTVNYRHALAGAIIAELILKEIAVVENVRKSNYLKLKNSRPTGDEILDECIQKIAGTSRRAQIKTWVQRFSQLRRMKTRVAQQLCRKRILKEDENNILFIFKQKIYPEVDPRPEKRILDRMEKTILGGTGNVESETIILISICNSTGLLNKLFDRKRLKGRKGRIKQLLNGELIGKATKEAIEAIQVAVMVAVIIPAVTANAAH
ncbi:MAG: GPP34 family phosphoprotein [Bacteroidales bacterium]|nr:GPP34 family phosphoprotein [Bacteroidales bacterium]